MANYTIIALTDGEYCYAPRDYGDDQQGQLNRELSIHYCTDLEEAASIYAKFVHSDKDMCEIKFLKDGIDMYDLSEEEFAEITKVTDGYAFIEAEQKKIRAQLRKEEAARAAEAEARKLAEKKRREQEAQFEYLRQQLGR